MTPASPLRPNVMITQVLPNSPQLRSSPYCCWMATPVGLVSEDQSPHDVGAGVAGARGWLCAKASGGGGVLEGCLGFGGALAPASQNSSSSAAPMASSNAE